MGKKITVNNKMQKGYSYETTNEKFRDDFKPQLTPKEILELGAFGGLYFNDVVKTNEYPKELFSKAKLSGLGNGYNKDLNYYKVKCGQSLKEWEENGWIKKQDPRGWFEWYARYSVNGRRSDDDDRQIKRWKNAERFIKSAITRHKSTGEWSKALLQSALHWGYDPRKYLKMKD